MSVADRIYIRKIFLSATMKKCHLVHDPVTPVGSNNAAIFLVKYMRCFRVAYARPHVYLVRVSELILWLKNGQLLCWWF